MYMFTNVCIQDLGFGEGFFFYSNSGYKSIQKLLFSALGKILVLVNCFFLFKFKLQKFSKIVFLSFWQDLGFGELFFSIQIQITKVFKN